MICFLWIHDWSKWSEPSAVMMSNLGLVPSVSIPTEYQAVLQESYCLKCNTKRYKKMSAS